MGALGTGTAGAHSAADPALVTTALGHLCACALQTLSLPEGPLCLPHLSTPLPGLCPSSAHGHFLSNRTRFIVWATDQQSQKINILNPNS